MNAFDMDETDKFILCKTTIGGYDRLLVCLDYDNILSYKNIVESSDLIVGQSGKVLIDQLLAVGNGANRFLGCEYKDGVLDFSTTKIETPDEFFRKTTISLLNARYEYVKYSILTEEQRECIRKNIPF